MRLAAQYLLAHQNIVFARRMVTRPPQAGTDHDPVTPMRFSQMLGAGALVWCWEAHGFHYGIEAHYAAQVASGRLVVVNGSREHAGALGTTEQVRLVQVIADAQQIAARLRERKRDTPQEIAKRLARNVLFSDLRADCTIVNQGELTQAGRQLADYLLNNIAPSKHATPSERCC
jgi:phosphonate metabolism protein PhnN/1,5-bisphosphokinase (PRPP-forming)